MNRTPPRFSASATLTLSTPTLSAIVLAGGHSRRMGQDKALLPMANGQPLLLKTIQTVQPLTENIVVVTPWPERYQSLLPDFVTLVKEPLPPADETTRPVSAGPLSGFAHGWQAISSDWCLLLACDLPYLEFSHLQRWWSWLLTLGQSSDLASDQTSDQASADSLAPLASLVPRKASQKSWEPLCGYYHRRCLPSLNRHLKSGQSAFQPWLSQLPIAPYRQLPREMLFNCNTPADWAAVGDRISLAK